MFKEEKELSVVEVRHPCLPVWRARIAAARARGGFHEVDRRDAGSWDQCAVGEFFTKVPHRVASSFCGPAYSGHMPRLHDRRADERLHGLGVQFCNAVGCDDFDRAERILGLIEEFCHEKVQTNEAEGQCQRQGRRAHPAQAQADRRADLLPVRQ